MKYQIPEEIRRVFPTTEAGIPSCLGITGKGGSAEGVELGRGAPRAWRPPIPEGITQAQTLLRKGWDPLQSPLLACKLMEMGFPHLLRLFKGKNNPSQNMSLICQ